MIAPNMSISQSGGMISYPITVKLILPFGTVRLPNQKHVYF